MHVEIVVIQPEEAELMLLHNTTNRPLKPQHVAFLAGELRRGRWKFNGDAIRMGADGSLIDGQHRLHAIVQSGVPIETLLITGLDPEVFCTIDSGAQRSAGDTLAVAGEKNGRNLAAALVVADELSRGKTDFTRNMRISNAEILGMLDRHPDIRNSIVWGRMLSKFAPCSITTALHYLFKQRNPKRVDDFFEAVHTGVGLGVDSPAYLLRQRLIDNATSKGKMTRRYMAALIIKAWNSHAVSRKLKYLRYREAGDCPEPFPTIQ